MTSSLDCYRSHFNKHVKNFYNELETALQEESINSFSVNFDIFVKEQESWVCRPEIKKIPTATPKEIKETIEKMAIEFFNSDEQEKYISSVIVQFKTVEARSKSLTFPLKELSPTCNICGLWRTTAQKIVRCGLCPMYYCGIKHQKEGWKSHKFQCSPLVAYRSFINTCFIDYKQKLVSEIGEKMVESLSICLDIFTKKNAMWLSTPMRQSKKPVEERFKNLQPSTTIEPVLQHLIQGLNQTTTRSPVIEINDDFCSNYDKEVIETIDEMVENFFKDCTEEKYIANALVIFSTENKTIKKIPLELQGPHCKECDKWQTTSQKITKCADAYYCSVDCQNSTQDLLDLKSKI